MRGAARCSDARGAGVGTLFLPELLPSVGMLWLPLVVGLLAAGLSLALVAYAPRMGYTLREPTEAETERLRGLLADVGVPDVATAVRTTTRDGAVECDLLGLPGRRKLVVSDAALDSLDDERLRALLAVEAERDRSRIEIPQALASGIGVGIIAAAYVTPIPFLPGLLGGWVIVLVGIALVRRRYYAADEAAGERVGRETLQHALRQAAGLRGDSLETEPTWRALFDVEPSVGARIERLRIETDTVADRTA